MRRSFEGKRHQPAKSEEKRKRCDRKHRGFGFFCAFLLCAGLISGGAAVSGESGAQEAVNAEAPADDAVQPEVPAQPVEEAQQNTPAPEDTEGGGEAGQQQEETPDQQQEELYPEDDGNGEESVPSVSRPDAGSAESSAAPVGTTAEPLTVSVTTAMKYAFAGENALTFETQITGGTEPFETSCEIDRDGTPVWSSQEYQPEVTYMPEEAGGYELVLSVTDAAGQAASGRCAIPVAVRHEESPSDWEPALKEVRMTGRYAEDLLAIARTQLGYTESADNFIVTEEGARQGYTRYGQWQGDAYEPWDAAFAAFCLYYAGVRDVPADTKAEKWADELKRRGMYRDLTAENRPEEGDFLFTRDGEVTRIGLVEKTDDTGVTAIEGDVGGAVARVTYGWDDARLAGFGDPRTTLTDEAAGVTVTGIFPEGATLTVQLLAEDADGFTEAQDRIHAALSPLYDRYAVNLADVTETAVYVPSLTVNGEVVSPCKKVRVGVSACGGRFAGHGDVRVLTFSDEQTELLSAEEKDGGDGADAIVSASFRTDRLSEFALTAVAPDRLTMRRTAADGDAKVTVTYGAGAGVPESAELRVRQIRGDGDDADRAEYQKRQAEAAALLETEAGGENAASQPDTAASGSPGNAENADVSRQTDQNAENAAADQQADQNAENAAADQTEDSKEYAAYMEEVEAALPSGRKVQMAKLFDITILDKEGNEVEPLNPVRANIEFVPKEVQEGTDLELYQFQTEGEKPQVMENVEVLTDDDNIVNGIEFETDGFSVYGIVGTEVLTGGVMTADGDSYSVTVKYDKYAEIPDDAVLVATEVQNSSRLYQSYMSEAEDALTSDSDAEISFARFFDVSIMADGEKIQPATPAEVIIDYNESQEITEGTEVSTLQFGDSVPATVDAAVSGTDTQVDGVSFQAEEVSVYGIVGTESITVPFTTGDGRTYEVTVDFDKDAGIPEDAQLKVSEVTEDNSKYDDYVEQAADAIDSRAEALNYIKLLNIEIVDENGDKVDLEAPVDVTIKLLDKEQNEEEQTQVVHFEGANEMPVVLDSSAEADTVSFSADGFSVYAIVYTVDFEYSVNGKMYQFSLPGGGFVSFADLVEVLGIIGDTNADENGDENGSVIADNAEENAVNEGAEENGVNADTNAPLTLGDMEVSEATRKFVADVASVEFSSPSLVDVSKVENETTVGQIKEDRKIECRYSAELTEEQIAEINAQTVEAGDWALISVQPFTSEESLTVTMKNGDQFVVKVTDAQIKKDYISAGGETFVITVTYDDAAEIPEGSWLEVDEILKGTDAYDEYLTDSVKELGVEDNEINIARFFDITIMNGTDPVEPKEPVQVEIKLKDAPDTDDMHKVLHFEHEGPVEMLLKETETDETGFLNLKFDTGSFSVYGVITAPGPISADDLNGRTFRLSNDGRYIAANVTRIDGNYSTTGLGKTDAANAAVWEFEQVNGSTYRIFTVDEQTGEKRYIQFAGSSENGRANVGLVNSQSNASVITVEKLDNGYRFSAQVNGTTYYLDEHNGGNGDAFAGWHQTNVNNNLTVTFTQPTLTQGNDYALVVKYEGKFYAVDSDGTLTPVEVDDVDNPSTVTFGSPMLWTYGTDGSIYHHTEATDTNAGDTAADYYYKFIDINSEEQGIHEEQKIDINTATPDAQNHLTNDDVILEKRSVGHTIAGSKNAWCVLEHRKQEQARTNYNLNTHILSNRDGNYVLGVEKKNGTLHIVRKPAGSNEGVEVFFTDVSMSVPPVSPYNHTVDHIDISIEGGADVQVPLAYGTYYKKNNDGSFEEYLKIVDGEYYVKEGGEWVIARDGNGNPITNDNPLKVHKEIQVDGEDIKSATITATKENGDPVENAFYVSGYSANAPSAGEAQQVRIEGVFKVAYCDPVNPAAVNNQPNTAAIMQDRLNNKVWYTVSTVKRDQEITISYNEVDLYDGQHNLMQAKADLRISSDRFNYWDDGNKCPPLLWHFQAKNNWGWGPPAFDEDPRRGTWGENIRYDLRGYYQGADIISWQDGAIYTGGTNDPSNPDARGWWCSGIDQRLSGDKVIAKAEIIGMEVTKYIIDQNGNKIRLDADTYRDNPLKSTFHVYEKTTDTEGYDPDDVKELNGGDSTRRTNEIPSGYQDPATIAGKENLYDRYAKHTEYDLTATIGLDGEGLNHNYNVTEGMYYITEDPSSVAKTIVAEDGRTYEYVQTHIESEYAWRDDQYTSVNYDGIYQEPVHISPTYVIDPEEQDVSKYRSVPEVLGNYKDKEGSWVQSDGSSLRNTFLPFYVYNVYRPIVAEISTTKQWKKSDDTEINDWPAKVTFKLRKKKVEGETATYSDITEKPLSYSGEWSDTFEASKDHPVAKWENLDGLGEGESYVIIEYAIEGVEETDIIRDENSGAIKSFKLDGKLYNVLNGEITEANSTTVNKERKETEIEVEKEWETPADMPKGTATLVLYQAVGTKPSSQYTVTVTADPAPVTTNDGKVTVSYTGKNKNGEDDSGTFVLSNTEGWSRSAQFDRGSSYTFAYSPDGEKILTVTPDKTGAFSETTTVTLSTETAAINQYQYTFSVPANLRQEKGSIDVTCNGNTLTADSSNNWTVEFTVAEGTPVNYTAEADGKFITAVVLSPASDESNASGNVSVTMNPEVSPLNMTIPVSVNWNETPDSGTAVTFNFVPDKEGIDSETVVLNGNWSTDKILRRLDDNGDLITWTTAAVVTSPNNDATVALTSPSDGSICDGGTVVATGTVSSVMNLTVITEGDVNIGGFYKASMSNDGTLSYNREDVAGTLRGYGATTTLDGMALKDASDHDQYYAIVLYSGETEITTNAATAGYTTNARENVYTTRTAVYFKAQSGDVTLNLKNSDSWVVNTGQNMNSVNSFSLPRRSLTKVNKKGATIFRGASNATPSTEKKFYDNDEMIGGSGDVVFETILFKDLPEGAVIVTGRDDATKEISGDGEYKWQNLPAEDADGNPIYYYIVEKDATAKADTMSVKYEYSYNPDGSISKVKIINTTTGVPEPSTGNITIQKSYSGIDRLPDGFQITNSYDSTKFFNVNNAVGTNPYVWTLEDVPDGTVVTFTESSIQAGGYNLTVNSTATAAASATVQATAIAGQTVTASLVNEYTPKKIAVTLKKVDKSKLESVADLSQLKASDLLDGAQFILEKYNQLSPTESKDTDWCNEHDTPNAGTAGVFTFSDLGAGIYKIIEKEYPDGYIAITSAPAFRIQPNTQTGELEIILINDADGLVKLINGQLTIVIGNTPGAALPNTGGPGTLLYTLSGILLMLGAALMYGFRMRRRERRLN